MLIDNLLIATDFSSYSSMAERRAAKLCKTHQCKKAEMINVEKPEGPQILAVIRKSNADMEASNIVEETLRQLKSRANDMQDSFKVEFECVVKLGQVAQEIIAYSMETKADLLVTGSHGGNFFSKLFIGNTVDKLIRLTRCPLLVVKKDSVVDYKHVLVPVDFTEDSFQAARLAVAMHPEGLITFFHAYEVWYEGRMTYARVSQDMIDFHRRQAYESARDSMNLFIDRLDLGDRIIQRHIEFNIPSVGIRNYAEKFQPDLIVMGKHGYSRVEELMVGSVTRDTIARTECDVLVVPSTAASIDINESTAYPVAS